MPHSRVQYVPALRRRRRRRSVSAVQVVDNVHRRVDGVLKEVVNCCIPDC